MPRPSLEEIFAQPSPSARPSLEQIFGSQKTGKQKYEEEDAAQVQSNRDAGGWTKLGRSVKAQAARRALGVLELANNVTGDNLIDPEVLAYAQQGADTMDKGTGAIGAVGNVMGDPLTWAGGVAGKAALEAQTLKQAALQSGKLGAIFGGLSGLTESTGNAESDVGDNAINAGIGAGVGGAVGVAAPFIGEGVKQGGKAVGRGVQRVAAGFGHEGAAESVAYRNIANALKGQGYAPSEVASIIDEFKSQGFDGVTLGQITKSSDLLAREKNLIQAGGKASRIMTEKLDDQAKAVAKTVVDRVKQYYQPEQTNYLYKQSAEIADELVGLPKMGAVKPNPTSWSKKHLPKAVKSVETDAKRFANRLPASIKNTIDDTIAQMKSGEIGVDEGKQIIGDLYVDNPSNTEQRIVNNIVKGMRRTLNNALEEAGGEPYIAAKTAAKRDMKMKEVMDAVDTTNVNSVRTWLNKFFGTPEKQREFMDMLPDDAARREFADLLANTEKVAGKFGGSDTASNEATKVTMANEMGFGFDPTILNAKTWGQRLSAPINKNVREAQAKVTFNPNATKLSKAMQTPRYKASGVKTAGQTGVEAGRQVGEYDRRNALQIPSRTEQGLQPITSKPVELKRTAETVDGNAGSFFEDMKMAESSGDPNARARTSSASGLYQFTDGTWKSAVAKWGKKHGITPDMKNDPQAQEIMVRELTADNQRILKNKLGRNPDDAETYVAHVMGAGDGTRLIKMKTSKAIAAKVFPEAAAANKPIFYKDGKPRTVSEVYQVLASKL